MNPSAPVRKVHSKAEHSIAYIKRWLGFTQVRYRGLARNENRLFVACALNNMMMARQSFATLPSIVLTTVLLSLSGQDAFARDDTPLPSSVHRILDRHNIPEKSLSLYVREFDGAHPLLATHVDVPRNPASVMKLVVTLAGLELLGPSYTWRTQIILDGKLAKGTLKGNLLIKGGGDPFLTRESFWHTLFTLRQRGLQHIEGDLLVDDGLFAEEPGAPGDFDARPYRTYNTLPSATLLNFHSHQFHIIPKNNRILVYADPPSSNLHIKNNLRFSRGKCAGRDRKFQFRVSPGDDHTQITLAGNYPARCGASFIHRSVLSGKDYLFGVFKAMWEKLDGTISGRVRETKPGAVYSDRVFYAVTSRPMHEIIAYINKHSNNVMARQLLLTLGWEHTQKIGNKTNGELAIQNWLQTRNIPTTGLSIDNGSGLSRTSRASVRTLAALLDYARKSPHQPEFFASFSLIGLDGTTKKRLYGRMPPGRARIKTGSLNNVLAMAGYVKSKNGRNFIVVSLQEHPGMKRWVGNTIQDELLKWVYAQGSSD